MGRVPRFLVPLVDTISAEVVPQDAVGPIASGRDNILALIYRSELDIESGSNYMSIRVSLAIVQELVIAIPISEGTALVIGSTGEEEAGELRLISVSFLLGATPVELTVEEPPDDEMEEQEADSEPEPEPEPPRPTGPLPWTLEAVFDVLSLRFGRDLLIPIEIDAETAEITEAEGQVHLDFGCTLRVDDRGNFDFAFGTDPEGAPGGAVELRVSHPFWIGTSRVAVILGPVYLRFSPETPPPDWGDESPDDLGAGLYVRELTVRLPPDIGIGVLDGLGVENLVIATGGFSGDFQATWHPQLAEDDPKRFTPGAGIGDFFGMPFALRLIDFEVRQNSFARASLACDLIPPIIEKPLGLLLSIDANGAFTAEVRASDLLPEEADDALIHLRQDGLLDLTVSSVRFELADEVGTFSLAGSLKPLVGGIDWPTLEVQKLSINTRGEVDLDGGWIDLPESFSLDFHAFKIELDQIGFGSEGEGETQRQWVGLSGGINLIEGIPLSASVEGLKVSWRPAPAAPEIRVSLEGIAVHLEIPGTLIIDGAVTYREPERPPATRPRLTAGEEPAVSGGAGGATGVFGHLFTGSISLDIVALNMEIAGELMIGELTSYRYEPDPGNAEQERLVLGDSFTALYIVLSADLPTALPLGATGAGLYGIKGLFGMHVAPDRYLDAEGEPENWYIWYKTDRGNSSAYNVTKVVKWGPRFDHYAFGAGLTIGTVYDDGFTINVAALAAILIPGPVVMIEGRANLLKQRSGGGQGTQGALYALIVFDGIAETFQMNVDVNLSIEDVITVGGGLEAFFDFNDGSRWFIHIGKKEPLTKRIRAEILSIVTATAYFMLEPTGIQFGAAAGVDLQLQYGPLEIKLILRLSLDVGIFWKEPQITGAIELYLELSIRIFGIGIGLILQALLEASAPQPWWIHGLARAALSLPFPLPSFDVQVEFTWGQTGLPALVDLLKGASMVHPKLTGTAWALPLASEPEDTWPTVPVDSVPVLSLAKPLSDISRRQGATGSEPFPYEVTEKTEFSYALTRVLLQKRNDAGVWEDVPGRDLAPPQADDLRLRPDLYAQEPQVELWWFAPLDTYDKYSRANHVNPCPKLPPPQRHCVDWRDIPLDTRFPPLFVRGGLSFAVRFGTPTSRVRSLVPALQADPDRGLWVGEVTIRFPEPVAWVEVAWESAHVSISYSFTAFRAGTAVPVTSPLVGARSHRPLGRGPDVAIDTLHLKAVRVLPVQIDFIDPVLTRVCWVSQRDAHAAAASRGDGGGRTTMRSSLVFEPNRSYRLQVTAARGERPEGSASDPVLSTQTLTYGFHTGGLPGTDYRRALPPGAASPDFAEGPLNRVESYVKRTVPQNGAPLFYRGYDVVVEAEPYAAAMLFPVLSVRILDRNGVPTVAEPTVSWLNGNLPFLTPGLLALLAAPTEKACVGTPVRWTRQVLQRYIACALPAETRPGRMYRVELIAALPYGPQPVYSFELGTSQFRDAREHLGSGLEDAATDSSGAWRGRRVVRPLGSAAAPPLSWIAPLRARIDEISALRATLAAALTVGEHDAGMTILEATKALEDKRAELGAWSNAVYGLLDRGGMLAAPWAPAETLSYGGIHELFAAAGLAHRPLPPQTIEALAVRCPAPGGGEGFFLLIESPEPLDWARITVRHATDGTPPLPVVWSSDGTRAVVLDSTGTGLFAGSPVLRLSFHLGGITAPDLDPLYREGRLSPVEEVVVWELQQRA